MPRPAAKTSSPERDKWMMVGMTVLEHSRFSHLDPLNPWSAPVVALVDVDLLVDARAVLFVDGDVFLSVAAATVWKVCGHRRVFCLLKPFPSDT